MVRMAYPYHLFLPDILKKTGNCSVTYEASIQFFQKALKTIGATLPLSLSALCICICLCLSLPHKSDHVLGSFERLAAKHGSLYSRLSNRKLKFNSYIEIEIYRALDEFFIRSFKLLHHVTVSVKVCLLCVQSFIIF